MTTGCPECDRLQDETYNPTALCLKCQMEYHDQRAVFHMKRIAELKIEQEKQNELRTSKNIH